MRTIVLACFLLAACASGDAPSPSFAAPDLARDASVSRDAAQMPSGSYALDPRHTSVLWRVRHWGLSAYTGRFDTIAGRLTFDSANLAASSVEVRIPLASVSTGLLNREGERAFDRDIAAFLGAESHPEIIFVSRFVEALGPTTGRITGDLSFNGQTHLATIEAVFEGGRTIPTNGRQALGFTGRMLIQRSLWVNGQIHNSAAPGDEVEIVISAEFLRS